MGRRTLALARVILKLPFFRRHDDDPVLVDGHRHRAVVDVTRHHPHPEGQAGDDRRLGRGVVALHVGGGVTLGVPQGLGLGQRLGEGLPRLGHAGEDEVGGAVDDAEHPRDPVAGEGLPQGPH
mgnify:CR=1 FL=1